MQYRKEPRKDEREKLMKQSKGNHGILLIIPLLLLFFFLVNILMLLWVKYIGGFLLLFFGDT